jgi:uncharacterized repeat protein (TIGR03803 family)
VSVDRHGNLFGMTQYGGANGQGTVFKIAKTAHGYASAPTTLVSFCALPNCADGFGPAPGLIADARGNLFGTTQNGGLPCAPLGCGTVFEITGSGFVVPVAFAGTAGKPNCQGESAATMARQYGGLDAAAAGLGYSSVDVLLNDIASHCAGEG